MQRVTHRIAASRPARVLLIALMALLAVGSLTARAQAPTALFAYVVYPQGWNLISPGGQTAIDTGSLTAAISGPLYTYQPGDTAYETGSLGRVRVGRGYWAFFAQQTAIALEASSIDAITITVAAGSCVMVGNSSTHGSARIQGAERTYAFSAVSNSYVEERLIGIGRGAWACNDTRSGSVSISYVGDVSTAAWPDCCSPQPVSEHGLARLVFHNDSPAPIIVGLRQMTDTGDYLDPGIGLKLVVPACSGCSEYATFTQCNPNALELDVDADPGFYTLHIQYEGVAASDLQISITVASNTAYDLCYFVDANRPQKNLP